MERASPNNQMQADEAGCGTMVAGASQLIWAFGRLREIRCWL